MFTLISIMSIACHDSVSPKGSGPKMVPDHTPYIAGLIDASPDTTFHYPKVIVGYFTDHQDPYASGILSTHNSQQHFYQGLYSITLTNQLTSTSILFGLSWQPESHAVVNVRGPLGTPQEKEMKFTAEGNGVYGDESYGLPRVANSQYKLQVKLPDGRTYSATTHIPESVPVKLKDSVQVNVQYTPYDNGAPSESSEIGYPIVYNPSLNSFLTIFQWNSNRDRESLLLKPSEHFRYADHGNYLRDGTGYGIKLTSVLGQQDTVNVPWNQELHNKTSKEVWSIEHWWLRFSFFSTSISKMFSSPMDWYVAGKKWRQKYNDAPADSALAQDTNYLHNVSTIRKVDSDGTVLPQDSTDAIGFFAGEYSRYLQTTLHANRQFDLDSVLTAWHNRDE